MNSCVIRFVVCAAIRSTVTGRVLCGARHYDSIMREHASNGTELHHEWQGSEQGFVDQFGKFMTREEAWLVAESANQIKHHFGGKPGRLFSEHLY